MRQARSHEGDRKIPARARAGVSLLQLMTLGEFAADPEHVQVPLAPGSEGQGASGWVTHSRCPFLPAISRLGPLPGKHGLLAFICGNPCQPPSLPGSGGPSSSWAGSSRSPSAPQCFCIAGDLLVSLQGARCSHRQIFHWALISYTLEIPQRTRGYLLPLLFFTFKRFLPSFQKYSALTLASNFI